MAYLFFRPPTVTRTLGAGPLFGRMRYEVGTTILRKGEFFTQVENPDPTDIEAADAVYLGGHEYRLRVGVETARLQASGYADYLFTSSRRYGEDAYGTQKYSYGGKR